MMLDDVKVGDLIIHFAGDYSSTQTLCKVIRLTPTMIFIHGIGQGFRKKDGRRVGDAFYSSRIAVATAEQIAQIREQNKRQKICRAILESPFSKFNTARLEEILDLCQRDEIDE